jgi:hypothetical protein
MFPDVMKREPAKKILRIDLGSANVSELDEFVADPTQSQSANHVFTLI